MLNRLLPNRHSRLLAASAAATAIAVLATAAPAAAAITASTITSPADDASFVKDPGDASSTAFTVSGTATGSGEIDVNCYSSTTKFAVAANVPVSDGTFSQAITHSALPDATCVLRAVDAGDTTVYGPGSATSFSGPLLALSYAYPMTYTTFTVGYEADFYTADSGTTGQFNLYSADQGGLESGTLDSDGAESGESDTLLAEDGALFTNPGEYTDQDGNPLPVAIKVDGAAAQAPDYADESFTGFEGMTFTDSLSNGDLTVEEQDPLMFCESASSNCTSSGVELDRTWQTADNGLVAYQSDVFKSTDGAAHALQAVEIDEFGAGPDGDTFDLPGTAGFASYAYDQAVTLPSGSGTIFIKSDADTPDAGDETHPQGAVVYGTAPSDPISFLFGSAANHYSVFDMPYDVSVPAGASAPALNFAYVQDFALTNVQTLAQQALASFSQSSDTPTGSSGGSASAGNGSQPSSGGETPAASGGTASAKPAPKSLGEKATPSTAKKFPYRYAVTGKITLPAGVTVGQGCAGKITLTVKRNDKKIASTSAKVNAKCAWSAKLTLRKRKLVPGKSGKLTITAAFGGNTALNTYAAKPLTIRYR